MSLLYIVATPIGNMEDITSRAIRVLNEVDMVAAEDTRHSRTLWAHFNIKTPMFSYHKFNEEKRGGFFLDALQAGKSIALISDAGTPCISDPGYRLVKTVAKAGFPVISVCGASAVVAALAVSGFDVTRFVFLGFLPRKATLEVFDSELSTSKGGVFVFYESPHRIKRTMELIAQKYPTTNVCLCNDLTKKFERLYRGLPQEVLNGLNSNPNSEKGEYTCVLNIPEIDNSADLDANDSPSIESLLVDIMVKSGCTLRDATNELHKLCTGISKKEIYAASLRLKNLL